jgi:putative transposase
MRHLPALPGPFMRNVLAHAGKSGRRVVSAFTAAAFAQETAEAASVKWRAVADQIRGPRRSSPS